MSAYKLSFAVCATGGPEGATLWTWECDTPTRVSRDSFRRAAGLDDEDGPLARVEAAMGTWIEVGAGDVARAEAVLGDPSRSNAINRDQVDGLRRCARAMREGAASGATTTAFVRLD